MRMTSREIGYRARRRTWAARSGPHKARVWGAAAVGPPGGGAPAPGLPPARPAGGRALPPGAAGVAVPFIRCRPPVIPFFPAPPPGRPGPHPLPLVTAIAILAP